MSEPGQTWVAGPRVAVIPDDPDEDAAIVRSLAEQGPFLVDNPDGGACCADCNAGGVYGEGLDEDEFRDPASHAPSCLWRRAKERYPDARRAPSLHCPIHGDVGASISALTVDVPRHAGCDEPLEVASPTVPTATPTLTDPASCYMGELGRPPGAR
jgi:hypothetical protein